MEERMYDTIRAETFKDIMKWCKPMSVVDIDVRSGKGEVIEISSVGHIADMSTQIRCYKDDILIYYDLYYRKNREEKMARVLLAK